MQKIYLLVKKTQKQGFSHFPNRFPSRVTARKVKIVNNELFLVMIKKMDCGYHYRYTFGSFWESHTFLVTWILDLKAPKVVKKCQSVSKSSFCPMDF